MVELGTEGRELPLRHRSPAGLKYRRKEFVPWPWPRPGVACLAPVRRIVVEQDEEWSY